MTVRELTELLRQHSCGDGDVLVTFNERAVTPRIVSVPPWAKHGAVTRRHVNIDLPQGAYMVQSDDD